MVAGVRVADFLGAERWIEGPGLSIGATARLLHRRIGAYSFRNSHVASFVGDLVRARSVRKHRALPVRFWFGFS